MTFPSTGLESASGLAFIPDGTLLSAGGDKPEGGVDGNPRVFAFDFRTETLKEVKSMASGRVFPSATVLGDGQIIIMAGLNEKRKVNAIPELWDGRQWFSLTKTRNKESAGPTFQFLTSDGRIFRAGPEKLSDWLNLETLKWSDMPRRQRNEVRFNGTAVMFQQDKIPSIGRFIQLINQ